MCGRLVRLVACAYRVTQAGGIRVGVESPIPDDSGREPEIGTYERFDSSLICLSTMAMTNNSGVRVQSFSCPGDMSRPGIDWPTRLSPFSTMANARRTSAPKKNNRDIMLMNFSFSMSAPLLESKYKKNKRLFWANRKVPKNPLRGQSRQASVSIGFRWTCLLLCLSPNQNSQPTCNDSSDDTDPQGHSDTVDDDFPALNDAHQMNDGNYCENYNYDSANGFHWKT